MIIDEIKSKVIPILKRYGAKRAAFFGSVVRGGKDIERTGGHPMKRDMRIWEEIREWTEW